MTVYCYVEPWQKCQELKTPSVFCPYIACPLLDTADDFETESPIGYVPSRAERVGGGLGTW